MLLVAIPFSKLAGRLAERFLPEHKSSNENIPAHYRSVLDKKALRSPPLAMACIQREIQHMLLILQEMMLPVMQLFEEHDKKQSKKNPRKQPTA